MKWERDNLFYGDEVSLPLSNSSGVAVTNGLTLLNHDDQTPGHDNWFEANLIPIGNQWKLPLRIELKNTSSGEPLADFWLGSMALPASGSFPTLVFEAENGTGGTVLTDAGASNGKYCRYDWTNSGWTDLASWTISAVDCTHLQGFNLLPFLRFFSAPTEANLKLRWKLMVESVPVWLGPQSELELERTSLRMEPFAVLGQSSIARFRCRASARSSGFSCCQRGTSTFPGRFFAASAAELRRVSCHKCPETERQPNR